MHSLPKPSIKVRKIFDRCVAVNQMGDVSQRCLTARSAVISAAYNYESRAKAPEFNRFRIARATVNEATKHDMATLYTRLRDNEKVREIYDEIRANAAPSNCPYCGSGQVGTLDHYLPKMDYPLFAITPTNLVPCCERCNTAKGEIPPESFGKQFLHPYFDQFGDEKWLFAELNETIPASAVYNVRAPAAWSAIKKERVQFHFDKLDLATVFITNAAVELRGVTGELRGVWSSDSEVGLKRHLLRRADSFASVNLNSWQTALYQACAASDWFCKGGFIST